MTTQEARELLQKKMTLASAYGSALSLFHWDSTTAYVPPQSYAMRGQAQGILSGELFRHMMAEDSHAAVEVLENNQNSLNDLEKASVRNFGRMLRKNKAVPPEEVEAYHALVAESEAVWEKAKNENDFAAVLPYYEKIFAYKRKLCDWYGYEGHPYNALLDDYEEGSTVAQLDGFFQALRQEIVPLLRRVTDSGRTFSPPEGEFCPKMQEDLGKIVASAMGFDFARGRIAEAEHPYTLSVNQHDVRITTHYYPHLPLSALYSTIHEGGHGIYNQGFAEGLSAYGLDDGASMSVHESQSRLYENMLGRSLAFAEYVLPLMQARFPQMAGWDAGRLYGAMNIAKPSLIRIEADELTYCLHIMVRYELEKALMGGEIKAKDLPRLWNERYHEFLGVRPPDDRSGVLQDTHWGSGLVGYFPSYAVGSAYSAQFMHKMKQNMDVDALVRKGDFTPITAWLNENVHRHGLSKTTEEILRDATGEAFNAKYFTDYLTEKFGTLYT